MALSKICEQCKNEYTKRSKQAYWQFEKSLYCSKVCKGKAQGFQVVVKAKKNCLICGKEFEKLNHPASAWSIAKYCSQSCYHVSRIIPDRSKLSKHLSRRSPAYKDWKLSVFKRDGWKCKMSNGDCVKKLEAHHILRFSKFPELRYEVNNGITLCVFHHPRKKVEENRLAPVFKELIWR